MSELFSLSLGTVDLIWVNPWDCDLPHRVARQHQVVELAEQFVASGWDPEKPALVGYQLDDRLQLLSGTHRCAAARLAGLKRIPVLVWRQDIIEDSWGKLRKWKRIMSPPKAGPCPP